MVDDYQQTSVPGVYAVGDLVKGPALAHVGFAEAIVSIKTILGEDVVPLDHDKVPWGIYCHPEVAFSGLTEAAAVERGYDVVTSVHRFAGNSRAVIMGETDGLVKIVAERDGPLLGVHIVGPLGDRAARRGLPRGQLGSDARRPRRADPSPPDPERAVRRVRARAHGSIAARLTGGYTEWTSRCRSWGRPSPRGRSPGGSSRSATQVALDEPLFEVSTDKVDSEVPAAAAGVLTEILVPEGDTVEVGARLAVLGDAAEGAAAPAAPAPEPEPAPRTSARAARARWHPLRRPRPRHHRPRPARGTARPRLRLRNPHRHPHRRRRRPTPNGRVTSPVVRRLIAERGLDPATITGTGEGGRITRRDVINAAPATRTAPAPSVPAPPSAPAEAPAPQASRAVRHGDEVIPFDNIRRRTADHVVASKATSAHVYTSIEVDFERIERIRRANQADWKQEEGFSLTYLPFIIRAFCDAVRDYPNVNASVDGESLVVHHDVHLGVAVDLEFRGLIAPVIRDADGKRLRLIAREIRDLATARARSSSVRTRSSAARSRSPTWARSAR